MKKVGFKRIKSKLILSFSIVVLLVIGLGVYNLISVKNSNNMAEGIVNQEVPLLVADQKLATTMANRLAAVRAYVLFGNPNYKEQFHEYTEMGKQYQAEAEALETSKEFNQLIVETVMWREAIISEVFEEYDKGNKDVALRNLEKLAEDGTALINGYEGIASAREQITNEQGRNIISNGESTFKMVALVTVIVVIISMVAAVLVSSIISNPIIRVMERMQLVAAGDLSHEPLAVHTRDEVGQLIVATNEMSANTRELLHKINSVSTTVTAQSEELTQSSNEVNAASEQVAATMQELAYGIENEAQSAADLATIMEVFTTKVEEANVKGDSIQRASQQVLGKTAEGTQLMEISTDQMNKIDTIVHDAVLKIKGLDTQTQEISKLVVVIKEIADQTNLLALNAAIEAARAGEHGKGFAVVAEEVKKLAEQVAISVTDITGIVDTIQSESSMVTISLEDGYTEVQRGTEQLQVTSNTFTEIRNSVNDVVNNISIISENLSDISASSEEMSGSVEEIAAISEQSAAGVQETAASMQQTSSSMEEVAGSSAQLAQLAEELNGLVQQFKI
ncbi:methyl-accepting chemotaxis protein [Sporosarcina soli]|uniref:Methyl-accepting chemotaxis protein n=1 Tax=Sporosarcina soli TaxID=334736 RepID=A0ABW0TUJ8_9BACL